MKTLLEIYYVQLKTSLAVQFQYRAATMIWMIGRVVEPLVYLAVWTTIAKAKGDQVGGYSAGDFSAYYIILMLVNQFTFSWIMWEYDYIIRNGMFSFKLLRPIHPIHGDIADNLAYKILTVVVIIPAALFLAWIFPPNFNLQPWALATAVPALILAFLVRFLLEWSLAMLAFWTTRISAINHTYYVIMLFMSGQFAPLSLLPAPLRGLANLLPFRWLIAFPVELISGHLSLRETLLGFAAQVIWLGLAFALLSLVWRVGVKRYSAVGS
jgi:ABC-2 type transport system permease protein